MQVNVIDSILITEERNTTRIIAEWSTIDPDITTYGNLTTGQAVKLFINWSDKGGAVTLQEGDYFTFLVPDIFRQNSVLDVTDAEIKTALGEVAATYSISDNGSGIKEIKVTFTDYVESHTDISGDLWLLLFVGNFVVTEDKPIDFVINGEVAASGEITVDPRPEYDRPPVNEKYGHSAVGDIYNDYYIFNWVIRLNMYEDPVNGFQILDNFSFSDTIPQDSPHVFLTEEIRQSLGLRPQDFPLRIGEYILADSYPPENRYAFFRYQYNGRGDSLWSNYINYTPLVNGYASTGIDGGTGLDVKNLVFSEKTFSADLGRLTRPTSLQYCTIATVKISESALGDEEVVKLFENTFNANYGAEMTSSLIIHYFESGGTAQGLKGDYSFEFTKVDESDTPISGVMFSLYKSQDISIGADRIAFSDENGKVAFKNLPAGTYYLLETTPTGYIVNDTIYQVKLTKDGFDILYGTNFATNLNDNGNKIINRTGSQCKPIYVPLLATKNLTNTKLLNGMFRFVVKNQSGIIVSRGTNDAAGVVKFGLIRFYLPGTYTFTIEEVRGYFDGITYDNSKFTVTIDVTLDGEGELEYVISYPSGGIVFNNTYTETKVKTCNCPKSTKCRKSIKGKKLWVDGDAYDKRPDMVEIILYRDGELYRTITVDSESDSEFCFACLPIWKNSTEKYLYTLDEKDVPEGYEKAVEGYIVTNTLK